MDKSIKVKLNDKEILLRKWKGSDKKNFMNAIQNLTLNAETAMQILVGNCVLNEEKLTFSPDEYRYLLSKIRIASLGDDMSVDLLCRKCEKVFKHAYKISEVLTPKHECLDDFESDDLTLQFGSIRNPQAFLEAMENDEDTEILFRIEAVNDSQNFTLESLQDLIDDLDIQTYENLITHFESGKFTLIDEVNIKCSHCEKDSVYVFDEIPGFFPEDWFSTPMEKLMKRDDIEDVIALHGLSQ